MENHLWQLAQLLNQALKKKHMLATTFFGEMGDSTPPISQAMELPFFQTQCSTCVNCRAAKVNVEVSHGVMVYTMWSQGLAGGHVNCNKTKKMGRHDVDLGMPARILSSCILVGPESFGLSVMHALMYSCRAAS